MGIQPIRAAPVALPTRQVGSRLAEVLVPASTVISGRPNPNSAAAIFRRELQMILAGRSAAPVATTSARHSATQVMQAMVRQACAGGVDIDRIRRLVGSVDALA